MPLTTLLDNEFEFICQTHCQPSEIDKLPYWKYEGFIERLNKKNAEQPNIKQTNIEQNNNSDTMQITQSYQNTIPTVKKRGRRSKASILESNMQNNEQLNESEVSQSFDIIYKSLTIKGKNYLLNLSTNEIFDMENILVGKKKGDKILFKKKFDILDV